VILQLKCGNGDGSNPFPYFGGEGGNNPFSPYFGDTLPGHGEDGFYWNAALNANVPYSTTNVVMPRGVRP